MNIKPLIHCLPACVLIVCGCSQRSQKEHYLASANRLFDAGDFAGAEVEYLNVLRIDPADAGAEGRLGLVYSRQGRQGRAWHYLAQAAATDSNNLPVRIELGRIDLAFGKLKEARTEAEFILAKNPATGDAAILLAETVDSPADIEAMRKRLKKFSENAGARAGCEVGLGSLAFRQEDFAGAEAAYQRALVLNTNSSDAWSGLGNLYWFRGDAKRAEAAFEQAAKLSPPRSAKWVKYAQFKSRNGDPAAARGILENVTRQASDYIPAWLGLAEIAAAQKNLDDCAELLGKAIARDPLNYDALLLNGRLTMARGDSTNAALQFRRLAAIYPRAAEVPYQLALAEFSLKDLAAAQEAANQALTLQHDHADAILLLAELKIKRGDSAAALTVLSPLLKKNPTPVQALILQADALCARGSLEEALPIYRRLQAAHPGNPQYPMLLGNALALQGKFDAAQQAFEAALAISPDYLPAWRELTAVCIRQKQFDLIAGKLDAALGKKAPPADLRLLRAGVEVARGKIPEAENLLTLAAKDESTAAGALLLLAEIHAQAGQTAVARENLRAILARNPADTGALTLAAVLDEAAHDPAAAGGDYEKILAINPRDAVALNNLAVVLAGQGQLEKAHDLAQRARDLLPGDPSIADTLGCILCRQGQPVAALALLQESATRLPAEPEISFHLGMANYLTGAESAARIAFDRALKPGRDFPGRAEAADCLAVLAVDPAKAGAAERSLLEKRAGQNPHDPPALLRLAVILERESAWEKAASAYNGALAGNPRCLPAMIGLAHLQAEKLHDPKRAFELAKSACQLVPDNDQASQLLGSLAYQNGDYKMSYNRLKEVVRRHAGGSDADYDLGLAAYSLGQVEEARNAMSEALRQDANFPRAIAAKHFLEMTVPLDVALPANLVAAAEKTLNNQPDDVPCLMIAAAACEQKANTAEAERRYEKILVRFPDFLPAEKRLAILYAGDNPPRGDAFDLATKAHQAFPLDADVSAALGILTYHRGNFARSAQLLKECVRVHRDDARALYYLGMAECKLKERMEGKKALQLALDLHLSEQFAAEARRILAEN